MSGPSAWHDSALGRDAGHDEMQSDVIGWLFRRIGEFGPVKCLECYAERPFVDRGRILGFADIWACWVSVSGHTKTTTSLCLEIKPSILSAGAIIRQCEALKLICRPEHYDGMAKVHAIPVVCSQDPKLEVLQRLSAFRPVWVWDKAGQCMIDENLESLLAGK